MNGSKSLENPRIKLKQKEKNSDQLHILRDTTSRCAILSLVQEPLPPLPWHAMKEAILGKRYHLSLVIAGDRRTRELNVRYRGKSYIPNVLSFPIAKDEGEIFLNLRQARREYRQRGESYEYFVALLVVHAMLHLKGERHGSTMEKQEVRLLRKFGVRNSTHKAI